MFFKDLGDGTEGTLSKCAEGNRAEMVDTSSCVDLLWLTILEQGVELDDLQRSLSTSVVLSVHCCSNLQSGYFPWAGTAAV